ncbi:alginate O-acetyltransferase AlgX-related protein [Methylocystis heyeri]|uniref:Alginate O-acetyltransferase n=1 Tax=Methylocystis heyeri TaxID=391905 RepID=A0A6B8KBD8_9HYPH|nr:alginate O-acetyltransferase [Methylocystis heyeri]QGM44862.1 alginate O-acetyltransferase [Methylocystis heyeri]
MAQLLSRRFVERLPIFACAGFIGFLFLANLWNFAVERDWPKLRIRSAQPLNGVPKIEPAPWTAQAFLSGETQKAVSSNIGRASPVFPISVRLKNQFMYSLFRASGAANIVVGREEQLFATGYIDEYCARGAAPNPGKLEDWADMAGEISASVRGQGKRFVYLVSPSKASHAPQYLPAGRSCPSLKDNAANRKLAPFRAALERRAVPFVDSSELFAREKSAYKIDLFPRGGIHWNLLGAALTLREASGVLEGQGGEPLLGAYDFDWREDDLAKGTDRDLLDLLNLFWPDDAYPTAALARNGAGASCPKTPHLLMVGDSFLRELIVAAAVAPCPPEIDYWFYVRDDAGGISLTRFLTAPGEIGNGTRLSADLALLPESFGWADAVVLEENESNIGNNRQVGNLLDAIRAKNPKLSGGPG